MRFRSFFAAAAALSARYAHAIKLDLDSEESITAAASNVAHAMMTWYWGNTTGGIPGYLSPDFAPYAWWEGGACMGTLIDYWYYTGDNSYNDIVKEALTFQASPTRDFMPPNQTKSEGNDDQAFWGFSAMTAAEYAFPNPPPDQPQWLELAQGVWNSQQLRWDPTTCHGGLHWQIYSWNHGFDYKNTPSNAGFMNLGARLYAYTGNETYGNWATKVWDWMYAVKYISGPENPPEWRVFDGAGEEENCTVLHDIRWTYNVAMLINGCAVMWNITQDPAWEERTLGLWNSSLVFFKNQVMWEPACEIPNNCDSDQLSFKAYFSRFMAASIKWMPQLYDEFMPYIRASASAAAAQCTGTAEGLVGNACGFKWVESPTWDGTYGFGQQMDALEVIQANLIQKAPHPVTAKKGGISKGDPTAGTEGTTVDGRPPLRTITTADRAGAGIVTAVVLVAWLSMIYYMVT